MNYLFYLLIGLAAAAIDTIPMLIKKLDTMFILSAVSTWVIVGLLAPITKLVQIGWLNGLIIALMVFLPMLFLIIRLDKQALPQIVITTVVLGAAVGFFTNLVS